MKLYLLITLFMWSVSGVDQVPPEDYKLFKSAELAAVYVYQNGDGRVPKPIPGEPDPRNRTLYEIDLQTMTMQRIDIPIVSFEHGSWIQPYKAGKKKR